MKKCTKCGVEKVLSEFGKDKRALDGHVTQCKYCKKLYDELYRSKNKSSISSKKRLYSKQNKAYLKEYKEKYHLSESGKKAVASYRSRNHKAISEFMKSYHKSPEGKLSKIRSERRYPNALRSRRYFGHHSGPKPENCSKCSSTYRVEAHHHDYNLPMEVTYFCKPCHAAWHMKNVPLNRVSGIFTE